MQSAYTLPFLQIKLQLSVKTYSYGEKAAKKKYT